MSLRRHTDKEYEAELNDLREALLLMGAKVEALIEQGMRALRTRSAELAQATIEEDREVNALELQIDERCLRILARRQPVASDLRFIAMALKLVTDLERIGDLAKNICERVIELGTEPPLQLPPTLEKLADTARGMLRDALDAFVAGDPDLAAAVIARDQIADDYHADIFLALLATMSDDAALVTRATRIQSISKYLERIADHATNVAETVVFMVSGQDIRHSPPQK